jgi:hypothetical protein
MPDQLSLDALDFGDSAADHERSLSTYFYRNELFDRACTPGICLVLGEKGAGKSAVFRMMEDKAQEIAELSNPNFFVATLANLREHFQLLRSILPGQLSYVTLWRFYFASIAALTVQEICRGDDAEFLQRFAQRWELNPQRFPSFIGATLKIPLKYAEVQIKGAPAMAPNPLQLQEVFAVVNRALSLNSSTLWIALDELDKVAIDGNGARDHSTDLLCALMQTHSELFPLERIRFKFFVRSDVYETLTYVDKDHFSNAILRLRWEPEDLAILLALRIRASAGAPSGALRLANATELISHVFQWPESIGSFDRLLHELRDGRGNVTPRDLLNFAIESREQQKRFNLYGTNQPALGIIGPAAVERGLDAASRVKVNDFVTTFPQIYKKFMNLQGHTSTQLSRAELQTLLGLPDELDFNLAMEEFWRIGTIAKKENKPIHLIKGFEIPPIYRRALGLKG